MLSEFDEGKRSCRKRLDGHNRRRRKPQHDMMNLGGFFPYHQANQFAICQRTIPTAGQSSDTMHLPDHQTPFSISFSGTFKAPKQFPFSQDGGSMLNAACSGHPLAEDRSHTRSSTLGPECALSLLSSPLPPSPVGIPTAGQAQVASSLARLAPASQAASSLVRLAPASQAATAAFASGGGHHVFIPDAVFEDPFPWQ
uniref:SBP-type domain-containing protein n=1 Tax=Arundo donax TaxID=35708 RepID=A0A0A9D5K2_ARUDO